MVEILDFYDILVNELVGDPTLFIFLALALVTIILVKARAPTQIFLMTIIAVGAMLSIWFPVLRWFLVIFGLGTAAWKFRRIGRE